MIKMVGGVFGLLDNPLKYGGYLIFPALKNFRQ